MPKHLAASLGMRYIENYRVHPKWKKYHIDRQNIYLTRANREHFVCVMATGVITYSRNRRMSLKWLKWRENRKAIISRVTLSHLDPIKDIKAVIEL